MADAARRERGKHLGEHTQPLFQHQPTEKADRHLVVADPQRAPPCEAARLGMEAAMVDPARPVGDRCRHSPLADQGGDRGGWCQDQIGAIVEPPQDAQHHRLQQAIAVIAKIGIEAGVDRGDHRHSSPPRPGDRGMAQELGRGDMNEVGCECLQVAARACGQAAAQFVLAPPARKGKGRHIDQVATRRKGGGVRGRRIDPHRRARAEQMLDQQVQRLVGAVTHVIIVAAEQGHAEV